MLGEIWTFAELTRAGIRAAETDCARLGQRCLGLRCAPADRTAHQPAALVPRVNDIIRELGAHNHLTAPVTAQLANPALRPLLERYLHGAPGVDAARRARVFRLAWDFVGTALASRNEQYERFYMGSAARNLLHAQQRARSHPRTAATGAFPGGGSLRQRGVVSLAGAPDPRSLGVGPAMPI